MTALHFALDRKSIGRTEGLSPSFFCVLSISLMLVPTALGFDKPKAYTPHPTPKIAPELDDDYDLLYFRSTGPLWIRFHVRAGGEVIAKRWDRYLDAFFDDLDTNGDGHLDAAECERLPSPQMLKGVIQNGYIGVVAAGPAALKEADTDRDGRVDRAELAAFYARNGVVPFRLQPMSDPDPYAEGITRAIFQSLDTDRDGQLNKGEVSAAETILDQNDLDEDECLTVQELLPLYLNRGYPRNQNPPNLDRWLLSRPGEPVNGLAQRFLALYDADKDYQISRRENAMGKARFDRLDRNHNGVLDVPELADFFEYANPDVEAWFDAGGTNRFAEVKRFSMAPQTAGIRHVLKCVRIELEFDEALEIGSAPGSGGRPIGNIFRQSMIQSFQFAAGAKGFIDNNDVKSPRLRGFQAYMTLGDRNRDGRLTRDEWTRLIDRQSQLSEATVTFCTVRVNPNWFTAMDANHDGRLSRTELRSAWKSLAPWTSRPAKSFCGRNDRRRCGCSFILARSLRSVSEH